MAAQNPAGVLVTQNLPPYIEQFVTYDNKRLRRFAKYVPANFGHDSLRVTFPPAFHPLGLPMQPEPENPLDQLFDPTFLKDRTRATAKATATLHGIISAHQGRKAVPIYVAKLQGPPFSPYLHAAFVAAEIAKVRQNPTAYRHELSLTGIAIPYGTFLFEEKSDAVVDFEAKIAVGRTDVFDPKRTRGLHTYVAVQDCDHDVLQKRYYMTPVNEGKVAQEFGLKWCHIHGSICPTLLGGGGQVVDLEKEEREVEEII